jgi:hypothetical protein
MSKPQWVLDREHEHEIMGPVLAGPALPRWARPVLTVALVVLAFAGICALAAVVYAVKAGVMYAIGKAVVEP